jgi:hypothetical protein
MALELPVVCGRSSFKPEVGPSGFSFLIDLQKPLIIYKLTRYFLKTPLSKTRYRNQHRIKPIAILTRQLGEKLEKKIWVESKELKGGFNIFRE